MEPESDIMPPAPEVVEAPNKPFRKRAAHACLRCRARKVRCDASLHGRACMNCQLDHVNCEVVRSRRSRVRPSQAEPLAEPGKVPRNYDSKANEQEQSPLASQSDRETAVQIRQDPKSFAEDQLLEKEPRGLQDGSSPTELSSPKATDASEHGWDDCHGVGPYPSSPYVSYTDYDFLTIGNLQHMPSHDVQFLGMKGCLKIPSRPILDEFLQQYFLHMHPLLPLVDEGEFWDTYSSTSSTSLQGDKMSLVVFQAMLFSCCNFISQSTLGKLGLDQQEAHTVLYHRAKLLLDLDAEVSCVPKSQAALLLASWSFPGSNISHTPETPWLSIAIEHAINAEAHRYEDAKSLRGKAVLKRLWWCCIVRDRIFSLVSRRNIHIDFGRPGFDPRTPLGLLDLTGEFHRSRVHDLSTKVQLAKVFDLLVELCVVLTDVLRLASPIEAKFGQTSSRFENRTSAGQCRAALYRWHRKASLRLPRFGAASSATSSDYGQHDSVILYTTLLRIYYYSSQVVLNHHELFHLVTASPPLAPSFSTEALRNNTELLEAVMGTTNCLEKLLRLRLARWLPISAVSCTALPLLLHIFDAKTSGSNGPKPKGKDISEHRLKVLRGVMETYEFQYEGTDWIHGAIKQIVRFKYLPSALDSAKDSGGWQFHTANTSSWVRMLTMQPSWYLHFAFAIDLTLNRGCVPDNEVLRGLQMPLVYPHPQDRLLGQTTTKGHVEPEKPVSAISAAKDDQDLMSVVSDSRRSPVRKDFSPTEDDTEIDWAHLLEAREFDEFHEATWVYKSSQETDGKSGFPEILMPWEISAGEGLDVLSQYFVDGSLNAS